MKDDVLVSASQPQQQVDEPRLVERLRGGDVGAVEQMILLHRPRMTRLVGRLLGWTGDCEDVVQDVFVAAIGAAAKFRGQCTLETWLTRIAINLCRSHQRTRMFRTAFWRGWISRQQLPQSPGAGESAEQRERIRCVTLAVQRLNSTYREVVVLHYLEGMPPAEVAAVLGIAKNTVEVRLHRARKALQEMLEPLMRQ